MSLPDHYEILGIRPTATVEQVKAAYRRQALRYHPDKNPDSADAAERFKLCSEAYAVLADPERRVEYEQRQRDGRGVQEVARDIIGDFLGKRQRRRDGKDLRFDLVVSLVEAAEGMSKRISFPAADICGRCVGCGAAPGGSVRCPACNGKGDVRDGGGFLSLPRRCPRCGGQGLMVTLPCDECGGVGTVERTRGYTVKLPPGVRDGDVKILEGEGEQGSGGGRPGDLHIVVQVERHALLRQDGLDLVLELPVRFALAVLGGTAEVPTLGGSVRMKVPAGTQSGRVFRLRGRGFPGSGGRHGDQLVHVLVETPVQLDEEARRRLAALDESCVPGTHPRLEAFAARIGELEE